MSNQSSNLLLYGHSRPKNKPIPISESSIQSLSIELSLAKEAARSGISSSSSSKKRKVSAIDSIASNKGVEKRSARDLIGKVKVKGKNKNGGRSDLALTEEEYQRSKQKMEMKSRKYEQLRRGLITDDENEDLLVDFDRKHVEEEGLGSGDDGSGGGGDDSDDNDDSDGGGTSEEPEEEKTVEVQDEFGRTRLVSQREYLKMQRQQQKGKVQENGVSNNDNPESSRQPQPPENVIYGPTIQHHAIQTTQDTFVLPSERFAAEAEENRGRSQHYDAASEIRTKGVGFYGFSQDEQERMKQMGELEEERRRTGEERKKRAEWRRRKMAEMEKRKEEIRRRRRIILGGLWLEREMDGIDIGAGAVSSVGVGSGL